MDGFVERSVLKGEHEIKPTLVIFGGLLKLFRRNNNTEIPEGDSLEENEKHVRVRNILANWAGVDQVEDGDKLIDLNLDPQNVIMSLMVHGYIRRGVVVNDARNFTVRDLLRMVD